MTARRCVALVTLAIVACAVVGLLIPLPSTRDATSPDGAFVVVAKTRLIDGLMPVMPGHGGGKPGWVTLYRKDGRSCGTAPVAMVSLIYDLRWDLDARPRTARIGPIATWNLDDCIVMVSEI